MQCEVSSHPELSYMFQSRENGIDFTLEVVTLSEQTANKLGIRYNIIKTTSYQFKYNVN